MSGETFQLQQHFQVPIMAWYHPQGGKRILSQLVAFGSDLIILNGSAEVAPQTPAVIDLQLPVHYPKLTKVKGFVTVCDEKIPNTLYLIHCQYQPDGPEAAREIEIFIKAIKGKLSGLARQGRTPMPSPAVQEKWSLPPPHLMTAFWTNLPDFTTRGSNRFPCALDGNLMTEGDDSTPMHVRAVGPTGLEFQCDERFFLNTPVRLSLPFPTNSKKASGHYVLTGEPQATTLEVVVKQVLSGDSRFDNAYQADWGKPVKAAFDELQCFLLTLAQKELGREVLETWLENLEGGTPEQVPETSRPEHRRFERKRTSFQGILFDEITFEQEKGRVVDISLGGARIELGHSFSPGTQVLLRFDHSGGTFRIAAQIRWTHHNQEDASHELGLQFTTLQPADREGIEKIIQGL